MKTALMGVLVVLLPCVEDPAPVADPDAGSLDGGSAPVDGGVETMTMDAGSPTTSEGDAGDAGEEDAGEEDAGEEDASPIDSGPPAGTCNIDPSVTGTPAAGGPYATITEGLADSECTLLQLLAGTTYDTERNISITRDIAIVGGHPFTTIIEPAAGSGPIFEVSGDVLVEIVLLTLQGGNHNPGGAIYAYADGADEPELELWRVTLQNNSSSNGGAIHQTGGTLRLRENSFENNHASNHGGAIWIDGVALEVSAEGVGTGFGSNTANIRGGAIWAHNSELDIEGARFVGNAVGDTNPAISTTAVQADGGAMWIEHVGDGDPPLASIFGTLLTLNFARSGSGTVRGGAIGSEGVELELTQVAFFQNYVETVGAGGSANGGALYVNGAETTIARTAFVENRADGGTSLTNMGKCEGGAIYTNCRLDMTIVNSLFDANVAESQRQAEGGAISVNPTGCGTNKLTMANVTITDNRAIAHHTGTCGNCDYGGALSLGNWSATIENSILYGNTVNPDGSEVADNCKFAVDITNGWFNSNGYNVIGEGCSLITATGDLSTDPLLQTRTSAQIRIPGTGSPAIDAGDPAGCQNPSDRPNLLTDDQRGGSFVRPVGTRCDIGAIEVVPD